MLHQLKFCFNRIKGVLVVFLLLFSGSLFAQPDPTTGPSCWPPPCIPIDGGIGFLIAAGVAFGIKKTIDFKSGKQES